MTPGIGIVFGLVALAGVLFAVDRVPNDMAALGLAVTLAALGRWTGVTPADAVAGFASPAVLTILAMFVLSEGVRRSGVVQRAARRLLPFTEGRPDRQLWLTLGLAGPPAGFVNNTPVVAVLAPLVADLARRHRTSPSRLLMPLSFVAMMGGMLTVMGTSTSLVASDLSARLLDRPIPVFEFTHLGLLVLAAGVVYLVTAGRWLVPERIPAEQDLTRVFGMREHLVRARVEQGSALAGRTLPESQAGEDWDLDVVRIGRGDRAFPGPDTDRIVEPGDVLTIRARPETLEAFARAKGLRRLPRETVVDEDLVDEEATLVEATLPEGSPLAGETLVSRDFRRRDGGTVLAVRQGDRLVRGRVEDRPLREGDSLLVLVERSRLGHLEEGRILELTGRTPVEAIREVARREAERESPGSGRRALAATAILVGVVGVAAAGLLPIHVSALGGVVAMVAAGCLRTDQAYAAVRWDIVFLLAGVLPLGVAMDRTGAAALLAEAVLGGAEVLPPLAVLGIFYLLTALLTGLVSNNAAVVLMIPVAVDAARAIGASPFAFLLAVTFAAGASFLTPVSSQTNLLVHTPGGYRFGDYLRVGAPLQLLLAVVVTAGIGLFWGV